MITRRRSTRSDATPPRSVNAKIGIIWSAPTRPIVAGEFVSS
jgi:hypothetical protein